MSQIRSAHARLAAIRRWRPDDAAAIASAERALQVAQVTANLTAAATAFLRTPTEEEEND